MAEQSSSGTLGGPVTLTLSLPSLPDPVKVAVTMPPRSITLSELQRLKRQFVSVHKKAITLGTVEKGAVDWSEGSLAGKFGGYLEENLRG